MMQHLSKQIIYFLHQNKSLRSHCSLKKHLLLFAVSNEMRHFYLFIL